MANTRPNSAENQAVNSEQPEQVFSIKVSEEHISCPLSLQIFHRPVTLLNQVAPGVTQLGTTVEEEFYREWVAHNGNRPLDPLNRYPVTAQLFNREKLALVDQYFRDNFPTAEEEKKARAERQYQPRAAVVAPAPAVVAPPPAPVVAAPAPLPAPVAPVPVQAVNPAAFFQGNARAVNLPLAVGVLPHSLPHPEAEQLLSCKGSMLGDGVAKNAFISAAIRREQNVAFSSIGVDFQVIGLDQRRFYIWNSAGMERFRHISHNHLGGVQFILFFGNNFADVNAMIQSIRINNMEFYALAYHREENELIPALREFNNNNFSAPVAVPADEVRAISAHLLNRLAELIQSPQNQVDKQPAKNKKNGCNLM